MSVKERFIRYVKIDTQSNPETGAHPSTEKQFALARLLTEELKALGAQDVRLDEHCYVYAQLPANAEGLPSLGFIAHMDTEPVCSGRDVKPDCVVCRGDVRLKNGKIISESEFPVLKKYVGKELIVTDGSTLLGADDKAGVAEIMQLVEELSARPEIRHGKIGIAFTPDEEIGEGASLFDVAGFGCNFAYTVDGEELGELGYETFNAAEAVVDFKGKNIHPGSAKGKMINCAVMAGEFLASLPADETPATTEGREGFYHVESVRAEVETGQIKLIVRDHDMEKFEARKKFVCDVCERLNEKYGRGAAGGKAARSVFQLYRKNPPALSSHRKRAQSVCKGGRNAYRGARAGRHGRMHAFLYGASLPQPFYGRPQRPFRPRIYPYGRIGNHGAGTSPPRGRVWTKRLKKDKNPPAL